MPPSQRLQQLYLDTARASIDSYQDEEAQLNHGWGRADLAPDLGPFDPVSAAAGTEETAIQGLADFVESALQAGGLKVVPNDDGHDEQAPRLQLAESAEMRMLREMHRQEHAHLSQRQRDQVLELEADLLDEIQGQRALVEGAEGELSVKHSLDSELSVLLDELDFGTTVREHMAREAMTCETVALLNHEQLQQLGITKLGDRVKLLARCSQRASSSAQSPMSQRAARRVAAMGADAGRKILQHQSPSQLIIHSPPRFPSHTGGGAEIRGNLAPQVHLTQYEGVFESKSVKVRDTWTRTANGTEENDSSWACKVAGNDGGGGGGDGGNETGTQQEAGGKAKDTSGGIGILLQNDAAGICRVVGMQAGGAAESSGRIQPGSAILSIDEQPAAGLSLGHLRALVCGPPGTHVSLLVRSKVWSEQEGGRWAAREELVKLQRQLTRVAAK